MSSHSVLITLKTSNMYVSRGWISILFIYRKKKLLVSYPMEITYFQYAVYCTDQEIPVISYSISLLESTSWTQQADISINYYDYYVECWKLIVHCTAVSLEYLCVTTHFCILLILMKKSYAFWLCNCKWTPTYRNWTFSWTTLRILLRCKVEG